MNLGQSTALVTGGAVRIGRAICETLAAQGCGVVIHCHRSQPEAEKLRDDLRTQGGKAWVVSGDLANPPERLRILEEAVSEAGPLNVLINNASVFHKTGWFDTSDEDFVSEMNVNFIAPVMMMKGFAGRCEAPAAIINLLDCRIAGVDPSCVPYELSKKMLAEVTRVAAAELAPGIRVNGVAPGPVLPPPGKDESAVHDLAGDLPLKERPGLEDVARAVVFLLASDRLTGEVIYVDGGQHLLGK